MFEQHSVFKYLKHSARCIEAQLGEEDRHCFFVGTYSPKPENELHLVEFIEETNEIITRNIFDHPNEIYSISSCPTNPSLLFTTHRGGNMNDAKEPYLYKATLWRLAGDESADVLDENELKNEEDTDYNATSLSQSNNLRLRPLFTLPTKGKISTHSVLWDALGVGSHFMSLGEQSIRFWRIGEKFSSIKEEKCIFDEERLRKMSGGCFDPHYPNRFISCNDRTIRCWSAAELREVQTVKNAHKAPILSVDHNPNKPYHIVTAGRDRTVKFWDLRNSKRALASLSNHSHWIWCVKFNRYHDQLLISSGSDSNVSLWNIVSVSSAPMGELEDASKETDKLIKSYKESHEDSVYSCSWSANNAWVFATLSYDGRVVINHVPAATKYKILL